MKRCEVSILAMAAAVALVGSAGCKSSSTEPDPSGNDEIPIARSYITSFFAGDAKTLEGVEDIFMKHGMTKQLVDQTLQKLKGNHGAYKDQGSSRTADVKGHDVVYIPCNFERGTLDAKVIFNSYKKVSGFFFVAPGSN